MPSITVHVPATSANLGPGFDCLGLALNWWNQTKFTSGGDHWHVKISGEGQSVLPMDETNLIIQSARTTFKLIGEKPPRGLLITCQNNIPLSSGLGSSAAAVLTGILGANALLGDALSRDEILKMAANIEGHPDNVAPALWGGLVIAAGEYRQKVEIPPIQAVIVLPEVTLSTEQARAALPEQVRLQDAVFNIGRTALTIEALRSGKLDALQQVMEDRLHQPYRMPLIPGAKQAIRAAKNLDAACVISGAGPSLIAFPSANPQKVRAAMEQAFTQVEIPSRGWVLSSSSKGAWHTAVD